MDTSSNTEAHVDTNWTLIKTVALTKNQGRGRMAAVNAGFVATADIYAYAGEAHKKLKVPIYGAVVELHSQTEGYHCPAHVTDALKKVFPPLASFRTNSAAHEAVDWGGPIGKPMDHTGTVSTYVFI